DTAHETRVAMVEDGDITELFIERAGASDCTGNIYKGRVQRVLPGMQAAFVDVGLKQAAFLYVNDILTDNYKETSLLVHENGEEDLRTESNQPDSREEGPTTEKSEINIVALINEGQEMLLQVAKSPMGTKGARITSYISLPGRFLVLMPTSNHIGISRRIENESERTRLKEIVAELRSDNLGYIVRTAAEGVNKDKISQEMEFLKTLWTGIQSKYKNAPTPSLIHQELDIRLRAVRDLLLHEAETLIIDSRSGFQEILSFLDTFMPNLKGSVELYEGDEPIFDAYNLEGDISRALKKKVWLKSGGYIVIEHTEALVAIDVNTGRYVGKHNLEETILKTNLEAVKEIAYQIRLRDIGGIIIIDFIDMEKKANQEKVFNAQCEAFSKDRSKTHILPISDMGLIQMTRKRVRKPLTRLMCEPCFYCDGEGHLLSGQTISYNIQREIIRNARDMNGSGMTLRVHPQIAEILHGEEKHLITTLEHRLGKQITIYPDKRFHLEEFDILET
ncbi:MAG: Rne/Rng family ribonuclease, partial [Desulfobulbaceae bacterium]|nr:Rne/Rng family ribonuclease [Desulfobulbaceae bacterium]